MTIHRKTRGELDCFTRPEMQVERAGYAVITLSAARGLLESMLYRARFRWRIRRIALKNVFQKFSKVGPFLSDRLS